jgi:flavodoxin
MDILIVYETQYGNTEHLARIMAEALEPTHSVRVVRARDAENVTNVDVDLLLVGAPTHVHGWQLPGRDFLRDLESRGFSGVPAASFDTRLPGSKLRTGSAAGAIEHLLRSADCRVVVPGESFIVTGGEGPLAEGEEERARAWVRSVVEQVAVPVPA